VDEQRTAYGLAAGRDPRTGIRWVAVTRRHETRVALLRLVDKPGGPDPGFRIIAGRGIDSVEHSDGAAITTTPLGPPFPHGLLVVYDGERRPAGGRPAVTLFTDKVSLPTHQPAGLARP
jgi:myo-inositol-hexaphosphate 3-phosphohydrolase